MKRLTVSALFVLLLAMSWVLGLDRSTSAASKTSGQGKMTFKVLYTSSHLPSEAQVPDVLKAAHGGFAVDRRPGKGETYFALPGAGIIQISSDLKSTRMISTPPSMKDTNMHNATIWYSDGGAYLTFPGNQSKQVVTTTLDGKLVNTLKPPKPGTDLGHPHASDYFAGAGNFVPTDTEYLDGMIYVATGYSKLDYVLTAKVLSTNPFKAEWHDLSFGGKGTGVGQFGTGHGITVPGGTRRVDVADRLYSEIDRFTRTGQYISTLDMPFGSLPCDIDYLDDYAIVGALRGPDTSRGAPIYILENDKLISTIMIKEDLGLENFTHIHNAVLRKHGGKHYVIAQAWNPGDFAILEQVN
ncbi:MAG: hypothetical protein OXB98_08130 [Bryobacterales bacterium]|nr:hypothetical protein [Bryobacterales bacterium]